MKRFNDYDSIAGVYDLLGRLLYGDNLKRSQLAQLDVLPKHQQVLIIGGGTGWIINEVMQVCEPERIVYLEKSAKMIKRSHDSCKTAYRDRVEFICGTQDDLTADQQFGIIITNYFFDQFSFYRLAKIFYQLTQHAGDTCWWHWADFVRPIKLKHKMLMKLMLLFFSLSTRLATRRVYNLYPIFLKWGWDLIEQRSYFDGFMESAVFRKRLPADELPPDQQGK